ncbi:MAG: MBL fold metallo-hydrolase, partial [Oligoflexia bacterium]|nr:MBL fold metallo-hydrolase [Oligoflexia bacterium]
MNIDNTTTLYQDPSLIIATFPVGELEVNSVLIYSPQSGSAISIDPGDDHQQFLKIVANKKLKVQLLLHTHAHFDHIGASEIIAKKLNVPILLHPLDYPIYQHLADQGKFVGKKIPTPAPLNEFLDEQQIYALKDTNQLITSISVLHTPGHSPGHCCF